MFDLIEQYQAGVFLSSSPVEPSTENIAKLMDLYGSKGLIPTTVTELPLQFLVPSSPGSQITSRTRDQVQMITPDHAWTIAFESRRIMVTRANLIGREMPTREAFTDTATDYLTTALKGFDYKGTRCVFAMKGILPQIEIDQISSIRDRFFILPEYFNEKPTVEWTTRFVARPTLTIAEREEQLNVILDMNRIKGELNMGGNPEPIDRVQIALDINTFQENVTPRFDSNLIAPFITVALETAATILSQLEERLHVY